MWLLERYDSMSKLETNKKKKRDSLLDSAFALFTSKGINKTSNCIPPVHAAGRGKDFDRGYRRAGIRRQGNFLPLF